MSKNVAVLMGGYSTEYEISIQSGTTVMNALDTQKYTPYAVHILKDKWVCIYENEEFYMDMGEFSVLLPFGKVYFDVCYNTIHGTPGEDGEIQAYLKIMGIPQTSCDFYQSALTFNKRDTLSVLRPYGIDMAQSVYVNKGDVVDDAFAKAIKERIQFPCFVKPNRAGSSFGISKIYNEKGFVPALEKAFAEDNEVLIESFLSGTEVSVGVCTYQGKTKVLPVCEIVSENDFFDYQAKYEGKSQEIVPARLSDNQTQSVQSLTGAIYEVLKLKGICRIDFIFHNGKPHFVEVNSNPGLSPESIIPRQAKAAGISLTDLLGSAIESAMG
ncbi:D-alanine--D-alanine ligase [uncultured Dokdonia sp.]|uniref:D-alanine--D-alanine ligase n=1 Tax=uncultured Dokdonia sp. TaxID=575653 RepID=UPI00261F6CAD|nr:D-alanine--D-alanine ligase [uncultured Dokdonia sp.]